ncbi:MAG: ribose 5-phosphate isomerase B [Parcubacteria group bacterium Gr01-1014_38]|nr:MAG: ribose 5-phosphate isomerase B [Parcubacteria group bacterium Gr01-1014_38]
MRVIVGADHAATELKEGVRASLEAEGYSVEDVSPETPTSGDDYPDYAFLVAEKVAADPAGTRGILACDTGIGMAIAANKVPRIHAALVMNEFGARRAREHNNANILVLGSELVTLEEAVRLASVFLTTAFSGAERHVRRIGKITSKETGGEGKGGR